MRQGWGWAAGAALLIAQSGFGAAMPGCLTELHSEGPLQGSAYAWGYQDYTGDDRPDLYISQYEYSPVRVESHRILDPANAYSLVWNSNPAWVATANVELTTPLHLNNTNSIGTADVDGDGIPDWLPFAVDNSTATPSSRLRVLRSSDQTQTWDSGPLDGQVNTYGGSDMLGDGRAEIYYSFKPNSATWTTKVIVLDGITKIELWSQTFSAADSAYVQMDASRDIDRDGKFDIFVRRNSYWPAVRSDTLLIRPLGSFITLWQSNPAFVPESLYVSVPWDDASDPDRMWNAQDIDNDGEDELVAWRQDPVTSTASAYAEIRNALTFGLEHAFPAVASYSGQARAEQLDGDPAYEVIQFTRSFTGIGYTDLRIYDGASHSLQWSYSPADGRTFSPQEGADFNGDGAAEVLLEEEHPSGASNVKVIDIAAGGSVLYQTNPGLVLGLRSTIGPGLFVDGGDLWRMADVGNNGVLEFVQVDETAGIKTPRLIRSSDFSETWNGAAYAGASINVAIQDVDPNPGSELILHINHGVSSTIKVLGCIGPLGTPTFTRTPAPPSPTPSYTATLTPTPSATQSFTPLPGSPTHSPTVSPSFTVSPTFTDSPTPTSTASPSATATASPTFSVSPTNSATFSVSPTFTPALYDASEGVLAQVRPLYNPLRGDVLELYVALGAPAEALEVELFSPAMVLIRRERVSLALAGARSRHRLSVAGVAGGAFFARVAVLGPKGEAGHKVLRLYRVP